ncbi:14493_t:CDS:2 [Funneliformis caledonium]|uniref:ER membrane protein complex subunit 3 n=1 Tax=Funneliformis caledonium TaxID=1117310 RepID=A0A9N9GEC2_9GLOM|nr:14493_t:CDS:2 [Funneliformis caledonium]
MSQPLTSMLVESQALYLDPAIRDWVLIPIMVVMVLVGIFRDQVTLLIGSTSGKKAGIKAIRETKALTRGVTLRNYGNNIPSSSFLIRKNYLCSSYKKGDFLKNPASANQVVNPMTDPAGMEMMMEGMKKNFAMIIPQTVIMGWINFFFSGFVLIKLPFPLTLRFKTMLQRGVETPDMDVTWVSSLSWYFLNLFGLRSIFTLLLGEDNAADGMRDMAAMSQMGAASPGQPQDFNKLFLAESENLELTPHNWELDDIEVRLLVKYGKRELVDNKDIIEMEDISPISSNDLSDVKGKSKKKRT